MLFKTLLFLFLFYLLIKVVSNLFLPAKKGKGNVRFFYQTFKSAREQQQKNQQSSHQKNDKLDEIEEAEYEDITEEKTSSSV